MGGGFGGGGAGRNGGFNSSTGMTTGTKMRGNTYVGRPGRVGMSLADAVAIATRPKAVSAVAQPPSVVAPPPSTVVPVSAPPPTAVAQDPMAIYTTLTPPPVKRAPDVAPFYNTGVYGGWGHTAFAGGMGSSRKIQDRVGGGPSISAPGPKRF
jgi:hypothetical protein